MKDSSKTKQKLIEELSVLKQRMQKLEYSESDRQQVEKALRQNEEKYRSIIENMQEGYFELDLAGNYTFANDAECRNMGYSREELIGMNNRQYQDERTVQEMYQRFRRLYQTGEPIKVLYVEIIRKNGTKGFNEVSVSLIRDAEGKPIGFRGISRDITERKQAEEALRESESKYRFMTDNVADIIWTVDMNLNFTYISPSVQRFRGLTVEEAMSQKIHEVLTPASLQYAFKVMEEENKALMDNPGRISDKLTIELEEYCKDGSTIWTENELKYLPGEDGKPIGIIGVTRDISERKRVEEALRQSNEQYRLLANHTTDIVWLINRNLETIYTSPNVEKIRGFTPQEVMEIPPEKHLTPKSFKLAHKIFTEELPKVEADLDYNPVHLLELEFYRKDGTTFWAETKFSIIRDGSGKPVSILGEGRDITERKQAAKALRESEEKYRLVIENAKEGIVIAQDMKLVFANRAAVDMIEYSGEMSEAKPFIDFIHPDDRNMVVDHHIRRLKGEEVPPAYSFRILREDGTVKWVEFNTAVIQWNERPATLSFLNDITARKQAEEALRESEEFFKEITENSSDVIIITDKNGDIKYCSRSIERYSGYKPEELIGRSAFTFIHPDDLERAADDFGEAILTVDSAIPNTFRVVRKDGSTRYFDGLGKNLLDNPAVAGFIMNIRDITDRKLAEEEKRRLEERLQRAHKMEAIGTLAGGIAHDFNNLLMGIQGYASLALLNINQNDPNYEKLKRIEKQVQSGADLTRQLLGFARGGRYEVKPVDINDVIQKSSSMFGRTKKEITIHMKYEKNLCPVEVDLGQMEQVFMNLYVNAWQAMPGGGNIYLETENIFLNDKQALSYSVKPGKYVKITVTDTGTGMDEKTRERIFDPFFTTKEMGRGTGLGLATVYGIVNGHKGMINVYSELGHGTTFTIYLPASEKEVVKKETVTGTIDRGTETVLLVDDEKIVLEVSKELLESMGYRVYAVGSGQEAIALFRGKRNEIDLVILDMIMPGISGGETFDRLREINPEIKVLLSSGYSLNGEAQTIMDRGCKGFIQKPFQIEKLSRKVREMLD